MSTNTRPTAAHMSLHQTQEAKTAFSSVFQIDFLIQNSSHLIKTISEEKFISFTTWSHGLLHYKPQNILILKVFSNINDCVTPWNTFKIKLQSILKPNPRFNYPLKRLRNCSGKSPFCPNHQISFQLPQVSATLYSHLSFSPNNSYQKFASGSF